MKLNNYLVVLLTLFLCASCKESSKKVEKSDTSIEKSEKNDGDIDDEKCKVSPKKVEKSDASIEKSEKNDGVIDGEKWTLAKLSDSLDPGFAIDDALRLFGKKPSIRKDGEFTIVLYEISTPKSFENGVRMTLLEMVFEKNILCEARIGFASYTN